MTVLLHLWAWNIWPEGWHLSDECWSTWFKGWSSVTLSIEPSYIFRWTIMCVFHRASVGLWSSTAVLVFNVLCGLELEHVLARCLGESLDALYRSNILSVVANLLYIYMYIYIYNFFLFIVYTSLLPACQQRAPDLIQGGCEPPCGCRELNSGPLEEQSVLLTAEPSLQPGSKSWLST